MSLSKSIGKRLGLSVAFAAALAAIVPMTNTAASISSPASASISPRGGFYKGLTNQGRQGAMCPDLNSSDPFAEAPCQVTFRVRNGVVKKAKFGIAYPACSTAFPLDPFTGRVNSRGRFTVTEGDAVLKGTFVTRSKVKGTASGEPFDPSPGCSGRMTVSYTAVRK